MEIKRQDWETVLKENELQKNQLTKNYKMALPQIEAVIELVQTKLKDFPEEDPMPEDLKKVIKEVKE